MEIEKIPKQIWIDTITGKINCEYESLALKILLGRINLNLTRDKSSKAYDAYIDELKDFFNRCVMIQSIQRDLQRILSKGGM